MENFNERKLIKLIHNICRMNFSIKHIEEILDKAECDLMDELGLDSFLMVQLVVNIETTYDIEFDISDLDISNLRCYSKLISFIKKYIGEKDDGDKLG